MQYPVVHIILKRLRAPLILLLIAYTVAITGMVVIPGVDAQGNKTHLTIFEAFYFISYVATTIGFGEIPQELTNTQRLWVTFCIYFTVISWLLAIGNILSLLQDPALKRVWRQQRFAKQVNKINQRFFIICGYGQTGEMLSAQLSSLGYQCVVIDNNKDRVNLLDLNSSVYGLPFLEGDASDVDTLRIAGVDNPNCKAVIAVTNNDDVNVKISIVVKLLRSNVKMICRVNSKEAMANAKSFDTDFVLNPNKIYSESLARMFRTPSIEQLSRSLLKHPGLDYSHYNTPPQGHWIICGDTLFSEEVSKHLDYEGIDFTRICNDEHCAIPHVHGKGTETVTLRAAHIEKSVGIIAASDNDTDNLSIITTARHVKPNIHLVAKQNLERNRLIFQNAEIDMIMESSRLIVNHIIPFVTQSVMFEFLRLARHQNEKWGEELMARFKNMSEKVPVTYLIKINENKTPTVVNHLEEGNILRLSDLYYPTTNTAAVQGSDEQSEKGPIEIMIPLMLIRDGKKTLLPKNTLSLTKGDVILVASSLEVRRKTEYVLTHDQDFYYFVHGQEKPVSVVIDRLKKWLKNRSKK